MRATTEPPPALRPLTVRAATLDEKTRTVQAVLSTENRVRIWDWDLGSIEEVLIADGLELRGEAIPLLATHDQGSLESLVGSVTAIRSENGETLGTLKLSSVPAAAEAMTLIREGHLTDVSVGYRALEWVDLKPGETRTVGGIEYTAGQTPLRITTKWRAVEASLVPIGADPDARLRHMIQHTDTPPKGTPMSRISTPMPASMPAPMPAPTGPDGEPLRQYYPDPTPRGDAPPASRTDAGDAPPAPPIPPQPDPAAAGQRDQAPPSPGAEPAPPRDTPPAAAPDADATRAAVEAERARVAEIEALAETGNVPAEVRSQAIADGLSPNAAGTLFFRHMTESQAPPLEHAPAGHVRDHTPQTRRDALAAALLCRDGLDPFDAHPDRYGIGAERIREERLPARMRERLDRAAEEGHRMRELSLFDLCRRALELRGVPVPDGRFELIRRAFSGGDLSVVFTTSFNARLLAGFAAEDDTTVWCGEEDVPNFMTNERASTTKIGNLTKHRRGGEADHVQVDASEETYKVERYTGQYQVDEMDIIDDRFGVTTQTTPEEMGSAARQLRPNLVYGTILANAALGDGVALFHTTHANKGTTSTALASATLAAGIAKLRKQRNSGVPLAIRPGWLIVPPDLEFTARELVALVDTSYGGSNVFKPLGIVPVVDDRIGAAGVVHPADGQTYTGSATNWMLAAKGPRRLITVGYLRGTGRRPQTRSSVLTQGQWGMNFDVLFDVGLYCSGYQAGYYATGAS